MTDNPLKLIREIEKELVAVRTQIAETEADFRLKMSDMHNHMENLQLEARRLEESLKSLSSTVVTKEKFAPYEKLLGVIGVAVVLAIITALMASILK